MVGEPPRGESMIPSIVETIPIRERAQERDPLALLREESNRNPILNGFSLRRRRGLVEDVVGGG